MTDNAIIVELGQVREIPSHIHNGIEIFLLLKGEIKLTIDRVTYILRENDIVLCNMGEVRGASGVGPNIALRVLISEKFLHNEADMADVYFNCNSCHMNERERELTYGQVSLMLTQIMLMYYKKNEFIALDFKTAILRMLAFLYKHFREEQKSIYPKTKESSDERINKIIEQISRNYRENISLQSIADAEHISVHYLSRLFKKRTGAGFMEYLGQLRLAGAVNALLSSNLSVTKIALANGFSNVSSFNRLFLKQFGETPAKYRASRRISLNSPTDAEMVEVFKEEEDLARYLRSFDVKSKDIYSENVRVEIDAQGQLVKQFKVIGRIIRIGRIAELLKTEIKEQLNCARDKLKAEYAHFSCLYNDGIYKYKMDIYDNYEYFLALDYLYSAGIKPFFSFSVQDFIAGSEEASPDKWGKEITNFLQNMAGHFPNAYKSKWKFEFDYMSLADPESVWEYYRAFYSAIRAVLPHAEIGLQFVESDDGEKDNYKFFIAHMRHCLSEGIPPLFVSYYSAWWRHEQFIANSEDYSLYSNYIAMMIGNLAQRLHENGVGMPKVLLMGWNVLSGFTNIESNAFFRSALYADGFVNLDPHITDVAYWLNAYIHEALSGKDKEFFDIPSLFLFNQIKHSVFFSLIVLDQVHPDVIYQDYNIIVTKNDKQDLAVLVMNPCYFAPRFALDSAFTGRLRRVFSIQLMNIRGEKVIEQYRLDNKQTSIYDRWTNMGFPPFIDRNVIAQLNNAINLDYSLFEKNLEGSYLFTVTLDFNEMTIINIKDKP